MGKVKLIRVSRCDKNRDVRSSISPTSQQTAQRRSKQVQGSEAVASSSNVIHVSIRAEGTKDLAAVSRKQSSLIRKHWYHSPAKVLDESSQMKINMTQYSVLPDGKYVKSNSSHRSVMASDGISVEHKSSKDIVGFDSDRHMVVLESKRRRSKPRKTRRFSVCHPCWRCVLISLLSMVLGGIALASLLVGLLVKPNVAIMTTTTSTLTTKTSTSITTPAVCGSSCANQTWIQSSNMLVRWSFDGNALASPSSFDATPINTPSYTTTTIGYVDRAARLTASSNEYFRAPFLSLVSTSFTIEAWIYVSAYSNPQRYFSIFGICPMLLMNRCLFATVIKNGSVGFLYFGFDQDDCQGSIPIPVNSWTHVAFVFDMTTQTQYIYQDGILDNSCNASSALTSASAGNNETTIGFVPNLVSVIGANYFQGYIDELTVYSRAKPACEILEDATLAAHFKFDASASIVLDSGPNTLAATTGNVTFFFPGRYQDGLGLTGITTSYFQVAGVTSMGIANQPFSISFWIRPLSLIGVVVHVSSMSNGGGWCVPFIGFALNGSIVAQIFRSGSMKTVYGPAIPTGSVWTHIVETWSPSTGLRLYVNNVIVGSDSSATMNSASGVSNFITLGNVFASSCISGDISPTSPFNGNIDDFRIYSRSLTSDDVCALFSA